MTTVSIPQPCKFCRAESVASGCCHENHDENMAARFKTQSRWFIAVIVAASVGTLWLVFR